MANVGFVPEVPLSQSPFLLSPGWVTNCCFTDHVWSSSGIMRNWLLCTDGRERQKKEITPDLEMAVFINNGMYILSLPWVALTVFSHLPTLNSLNAIFLSQSCILEAVSNIEEGKQNAHFNDRGEDEEPPIVRV